VENRVLKDYKYFDWKLFSLIQLPFIVIVNLINLKFIFLKDIANFYLLFLIPIFILLIFHFYKKDSFNSLSKSFKITTDKIIIDRF